MSFRLRGLLTWTACALPGSVSFKLSAGYHCRFKLTAPDMVDGVGPKKIVPVHHGENLTGQLMLDVGNL